MKRIAFALIVLLGSLPGYATIDKKLLKLRLYEVASALADETTVYFDAGITSPYIFPEDAQKQFNSNPQWPQVYSFSSDSIACFSNGYGELFTETTVRLGVRVSGNSQYIFSPTAVDRFDPTSIIRLEDRQLGVFHDLRVGSYAVFISQAGFLDDRFYLHISSPLVVQTTDANCSNTNGAITFLQDTSVVWSSVLLYDSNATLLGTLTNATDSFGFSNLNQGQYFCIFNYGVYQVSKPIRVNGRQVVSQVVVSNLNPVVGEVVTFNTVATNANQYNWNFGDGTIITGVANTQTSYVSPGTYRVVATMWNQFGCTDSTVLFVNVSPFSNLESTENDKNVRLYATGGRIHFDAENPKQLYLFSIAGQLMHSISVVNQNVTDIPSGLSGLYIVALQTNQGLYYQKLILR